MMVLLEFLECSLVFAMDRGRTADTQLFYSHPASEQRKGEASAQCQASTTKDTKALQSRPWLICCFAADCLDHTLGISPALCSNDLVCCLHRE